MQTIDERLIDLTRRLDALEGNAAIAAPFRITDEDGRSLLEVDQVDGETRLLLYAPGRDSMPVLVLVGDQHGGGLIALDTEGSILRAVLAEPHSLNLTAQRLTTCRSVIRAERKHGHAVARRFA